MPRRILPFVFALLFSAGSNFAVATDPPVVETTTMHRKVLCGYQGWFRCPGDAAGIGWRHWSRSGREITPKMLSFEMWPDMTELGPDERYPAPGFTDPSGEPAALFSSANAKTVDRHFEWMREHGIDGVFLQRFLVEIGNPSLDLVLSHVRKSAEAHGRTYALCYDLSGAKPDQLLPRLTADWKRLVDEEKVTEDPRYLRHNGKPVLFVWGFFADRFPPETAHQILDFFRDDPRYGVTVVGGCQWYWRREKNPEWQRAFRRFDVLSPWNVGNFSVQAGEKHAGTDYWKEDLEEARRSGMEYLPVVYPGFSWTNLQGPGSEKNTLPRLGGNFYWRQFTKVSELGLDMAYVAMFDEVDEGTAIFKVTNAPPTPGKFATYEGMPADWYLHLTGEGTKLLRGDRPAANALPKPEVGRK